MIFHELTIHTNTLGSELVGGVLMGAGVSCFVTEDFNDLTEVIEEKSIPFDYIEDALLSDPGEVKVKVYLACNEQGKLQEAEILSGIAKLKAENEFDMGSLEVTFSHVDEKDWADNWKQFFHPLPIGNRFVVKPTWETYEGDDRIVLEIPPLAPVSTRPPHCAWRSWRTVTSRANLCWTWGAAAAFWASVRHFWVQKTWYA